MPAVSPIHPEETPNPNALIYTTEADFGITEAALTFAEDCMKLRAHRQAAMKNCGISVFEIDFVMIDDVRHLKLKAVIAPIEEFLLS